MHYESMVDDLCMIFKDKDLAFKRDAIASALDDPTAGCENAEWVSKHLCPETLLSQEELTLFAPLKLVGPTRTCTNAENRYHKLENSGVLHPILRDPDLTATRPVLEQDIRTAIQSLEASTAAIQQQRETLSLQCEVLKKQLRNRQSFDREQNRDVGRLRKKHDAGRQHTTIAVRTLVSRYV